MKRYRSNSGEKCSMRVAIIGIGVNGMACAHELAERHDVTVFHDQEICATTSATATAIWHVYLVDPDDEQNLAWSCRTLKRLMDLERVTDAGVELCRGIELFRKGTPLRPSWADIAQHFRLLTDEEMLAYPGCIWGYEIAAPAANMARYLPWLHGECVKAGVTFRNEHIASLSDLLTKFDVVVNCAGLDASKLVDDPQLFPVKGQYLALKLESDGPTKYIGDDQHPEGMAYVIPRDGELLVGGTEEHNISDVGFTANRDDMIRRASEYCDQDISRLAQLRTVVGLRPCRESGRVRFGQDPVAPRLIHNYGHGGSGFSLAWGCAEDVAKLVAETECSPVNH